MLTRLGLFVLWLIHFLPRNVIGRIGETFGLLAYYFSRGRVTSINLAKCFPELSEKERKNLARRHFQVLGRSALDLSVIWYGSMQEAKSMVRLAGREHLDAVLGKPVIIFAPHFVGLDVGGVALGTQYRCSSMYSRQKNPHVNEIMLRTRKRWGDPMLFARQEGLRPVIKYLKQGIPFYYLPDQDLGRKDAVFVPFFGVPTATITAMSRLARVTGAAIVPCITRLLPDMRTYETRLYPAWENYPGASLEEDTRRMNAFLEERIREIPEQYLWVHKRFKTRPLGEPSFYD
jgi:KDO2-lipid IV(A) lauroyltransferase